MEIFKLTPIGCERLWGGTKLIDKYGKHFEIKQLGETWECSTHPHGTNVVATGKFKGKNLAWVLKRNPEYLGKKYKKLKHLPILVKFIDANKDLSVQVHPNDKFAAKLEKQSGKNEMWYVVEAEKDAKLVYGFEHPVTEKILKDAVLTGEIEKHLHYERVYAGDTFYMPAGTVHGIGKGILIAEIQQSSDVTYRVYDYNRVDKNGNKRELHFDKAIKVMNKKPIADQISHRKTIHYFHGVSRQPLIANCYFQVEKVSVSEQVEVVGSNLTFQIILCLDGEGKLLCGNETLEFAKGECIFVAAGKDTYTIVGQCVFLKIKG